MLTLGDRLVGTTVLVTLNKVWAALYVSHIIYDRLTVVVIVRFLKSQDLMTHISCLGGRGHVPPPALQWSIPDRFSIVMEACTPVVPLQQGGCVEHAGTERDTVGPRPMQTVVKS